VIVYLLDARSVGTCFGGTLPIRSLPTRQSRVPMSKGGVSASECLAASAPYAPAFVLHDVQRHGIGR